MIQKFVLSADVKRAEHKGRNPVKSVVRRKRMKREFLQELGLEKDVIDKIMTQNGADINAAKQDYDALKE